MTVPVEAICQVTAWKTPELKTYCCALVKTGLGSLARGEPCFGCDDVPEEDQPVSPAVSGIACRVLKSSSLIIEYSGHHPEAGIFHGRRKSRRGPSHGREIHLYQVTSVELCMAFLGRNQEIVEPQQIEMALF